MAVSKAQQKAVTKYVKAKYDRFGLTMAKGRLDEIKDHAAAVGQSVNAYINEAIDDRMAQEDPPIVQDRRKGLSEALQGTSGSEVVSLTSGEEKPQETALSTVTAKEE